MKKVVVAALVAGTLCLGAPALAHDSQVNDQYEDAILHPLRLASYAIHPIGFAVEWLIGRPFQYIVSRDQLRNIFGYRPLSEEASYGNAGQRSL